MAAIVPTLHTTRVASGRDVGYYEFGDPAGVPVFGLHGTPASGAGFAWIDDEARVRGIRFVAPDRPGVGCTDRYPRGHRVVVADATPDALGLADELGFEQFAVLGYSGGGPYAAALAHAAPERVRAAAIVSGSGHVGEWARLRDFEVVDRTMTRVAEHAPLLAHLTLTAAAMLARRAPGPSLRFVQLGMPPADRAVIDKFASARDALTLFNEAYRRGGEGVVDDYAALGRPWGFDASEIRVRLRCWHGTDDNIVPLRHSEALVALVPGATLVAWPGAGHLGIIEHAGEVLDGILEMTGE